MTKAELILALAPFPDNAEISIHGVYGSATDNIEGIILQKDERYVLNRENASIGEIQIQTDIMSG